MAQLTDGRLLLDTGCKSNVCKSIRVPSLNIPLTSLLKSLLLRFLNVPLNFVSHVPSSSIRLGRGHTSLQLTATALNNSQLKLCNLIRATCE